MLNSNSLNTFYPLTFFIGGEGAFVSFTYNFSNCIEMLLSMLFLTRKIFKLTDQGVPKSICIIIYHIYMIFSIYYQYFLVFGLYLSGWPNPSKYLLLGQSILWINCNLLIV